MRTGKKAASNLDVEADRNSAASVIDVEEVAATATSDDETCEAVLEEPDTKNEADAPQPSLLEAAQAEAAEMRDRFTRLQAEWDNFRKRNATEREAERKRASERLVKDLLPVLDDFERALEHAAAEPDINTLIEGLTAIQSKLLAALEKEKVAQINPKDEAFDANRHQAVGKVEDDSVPDETVVQVFQKGYEMGGKVIRPAMVTVSSGGPVRPKEDSEVQAE